MKFDFFVFIFWIRFWDLDPEFSGQIRPRGPLKNWFRIHNYCLSQKSWPILHSKLLYKLSQDLMDIQYVCI